MRFEYATVTPAVLQTTNGATANGWAINVPHQRPMFLDVTGMVVEVEPGDAVTPFYDAGEFARRHQITPGMMALVVTALYRDMHWAGVA